LYLIVLGALGDLGLGPEFGRFPFLARLGTLDGGVAGGVGLADGGVALDLGGASLAQRVEIALVVADVLDVPRIARR
jgi:hypothetical protein